MPGLCDPDGYLWHPTRETATHATPDEVEREIRAQIEKAEAMGLHPTHIDSHMGALFTRPEFIDRYFKVGIEKHIPVLRNQFASLTAREKEVVGLVTAGLLNKQIAAELDISEVTVKMHRGNIMRKCKHDPWRTWSEWQISWESPDRRP